MKHGKYCQGFQHEATDHLEWNKGLLCGRIKLLGSGMDSHQCGIRCHVSKKVPFKQPSMAAAYPALHIARAVVLAQLLHCCIILKRQHQTLLNHPEQQTDKGAHFLHMTRAVVLGQLLHCRIILRDNIRLSSAIGNTTRTMQTSGSQSYSIRSASSEGPCMHVSSQGESESLTHRHHETKVGFLINCGLHAEHSMKDNQTCQTTRPAGSAFQAESLILMSVMHNAMQCNAMRCDKSHQPKEVHPLEGLDSRGLVAHAASKPGYPTTGHETPHRTRSCQDDRYCLWGKAVRITVHVPKRGTNDKDCKAGHHNSSPTASARQHLHNRKADSPHSFLTVC